MNPTATTTAATITPISSTIPTAVMTESSEKTMSSSMIWISTLRERRRHPGGRLALLALQPLVDLVGALGQEEQPADQEHQVAARDLLAEDGEERRREPDDPGEREEQRRSA